jgi:hypothetical protein
MLIVVNDFGVKIQVAVVPTGFHSQFDPREVNEGSTFVEFFDTRSTKSFPPMGQFIAKVDLAKLLQTEGSLKLSRIATEWCLSPANIEKIYLYSKVHEII